MKSNPLPFPFRGLVKLVGILLLSLVLVGLLTSRKVDDRESDSNPFGSVNSERTKIVVISDLHLGADIAYAEINSNRKPLENLLRQVRTSSGVKELVIAGDLLDEWFVPANIDTYHGKDQLDFVRRIAATNKGVIDELNQIIREGKIAVTYVPGNHDLTITAASVNAILPNIAQARDNHLGLGTYSPKDLPQLAIEHGHRYNFFCAPDPFSNQNIAKGTILPPGYFFTRIGALHVVQNCKKNSDVVPVVTPNKTGDKSQQLLYGYWKNWEWSLNYLPINNKFDEKIIVTTINGFNGTYSVNDLLPFQKVEGGSINVDLYKGIQDKWQKRQDYNNVAVKIPAAHAIEYVADASETDNQAKIQYFLNSKSNKRIVVFGHTHVAKIIASQNKKGQKTIYANSGTWIDKNPNGTTTDFVVITPQTKSVGSQTQVRLYKLTNEAITKMAEDAVRL